MAELAASDMAIPRCRSCGAAIVWVRTTSGKAMPVNAGSATVGDLTFEPGRHVSHFSTCPDASKFRRKT